MLGGIRYVSVHCMVYGTCARVRGYAVCERALEGMRYVGAYQWYTVRERALEGMRYICVLESIWYVNVH